MKKDTPRTFALDSNIVNSTAVVRLRRALGAEGFGVYIMLLCRLRVEEGYVSDRDYDSIAFALAVDPELVRSVVEDFGLFVVTDSGFHSPEIHRQQKIEPIQPEPEPEKKIAEGNTENNKQPDPNIDELNLDEEMMRALSYCHNIPIPDLQGPLARKFREYCLTNRLTPDHPKDTFTLYDQWLDKTKNAPEIGRSSCP